jgi:EAL domain-containing protein (putative c-di-GMP-specific phosphodiesterase class I)
LPASALHLELTESIMAESETEILPTMLALVDQGFKFHLDDFGTGYSSLDRLRNLPFDTLKIDRSFIVPLGQRDDVMVRNIINIGNELGMNLIAEGVETEVEVNKLLQLGCHQIQGYYFARPMPLENLKVWLADNHLQMQLQKYKLQKQSYVI